MDPAEIRANLEGVIRDRGEDFASLSRMIGRNPAYIQQFIKRGVPKKLDEDDRRLLAEYFGIDEAILGGPARGRASPSKSTLRDAPDLILVPRLDVGASAGPGALGADDRVRVNLAFQSGWLRALIGGNPTGLSMIAVEGDSMAPTLADGDEILVDRSDAVERLRDGIYVLRIEDALIVKRLAVNPSGRRFTIRSDNPAYPDWVDCNPDNVAVIGRVVWAGRKIT
ncbi:S24 family peptidase [Sphingomonas cavernae]|uniref:Helix-turn-helix transcriptional regulator n=1 Tax=Sphingomonas cavernae TaxID=2320861 RepID=A0A418WKX6_9SPHN|nr:S24 family peptidase [Sphingomonas cavernae]RJF90697.1 helix-turn-helix transcriptional regulator [Sphingomonas cavernae]